MEADPGKANKNFPNDFNGTRVSSNIYFLNIPQLCKVVNPPWNNTRKEHKKDFSADIYLYFFVNHSALQCWYAALNDFGKSRAYSCSEEFGPWAWCSVRGLAYNL